MYARGTEEAVIEFTSDEEAGQKVLRTGDEIYLFYPDASELIRLQGAALRQSMLGSDVSYEDMTGNKGYLDTYEVSLTGREDVNGNPCHVLELEAISRDVAYPRQKIWVDAELYVMRKAEQFALSGRLLKVMDVQELLRTSGKVFPSHITVRDQLKRNTRTEFIIEEAEINIDLPSRIFSVEELTW
jgi:outer membrane lipoprotein-sorting protein